MDDAALHEALQRIFGFSAFRPHQAEIVRAILDRRDAFVVMPTGGGKSLCYQLPAHLMDGVCLVISPLIALMKDQVDAAREVGLRAAFLNSSQKGSEQTSVQAAVLRGEVDLLYVSPERYVMEEFQAVLRKASLAFVAVDEAHCISEWGHDFRPEYRDLGRIVKDFPDTPIAAFTATATLRVQQDIVARLGLRDPMLVRASFNRPNLFYRVTPKTKPDRQILEFVRRHPREAGIIYRTTRKAVEQTAENLADAGVRAVPYHAGLDDEVRAANQDAFNRDEADVVVATIAFGMGIDKSNVRYVLHGDLPRSVEGYYQETGRAGRDGEPAECLLLFGQGDIPKIRFFIDKTEDEEERARLLRCLHDMVHYAQADACRRKQLLRYFGETYAEPDCGACDVCAGEVQRVDATRDAQIVLSAMVRTGERFGLAHVVDVVTGADTERMRQLGHDQLKTYGAGRDRDKRHWRLVLENLLAQELVVRTEGEYPILQLGPLARDVLAGTRPVSILETRAPKRRKGSTEGAPYDVALFDVLRALRKRLADEAHVPPFVVFSDRTLHEMARVMPDSELAMLGITGVGETKMQRYGAAFLDAIRTYKTTRVG